MATPACLRGGTRRIAMLFGVALMVGALATPANADDWAQFGYDAGQTRVNPNEDVISRDNVDTLDVAWDATRRIDGIPLTPPLVGGGGVFVGGTNEAGTKVILWSLSEATGRIRWRTEPGCEAIEDDALRSMALADGILVVSLRRCEPDSSSLGLFDADTGALIRFIRFEGVGMSSPTINRGSVYVFSSHDDGADQLNKIDLLTGEFIWRSSVRDEYDGGQSTIMAVTHRMLAISPNFASSFSPIISRGVIYAGGEHDFVDPRTGGPIPDPLSGPCLPQELCAYDAETGGQLWRRFGGAPVVHGGLAYAACDYRRFCALDETTAFAAWYIDAPGRNTSFLPYRPGSRPILANDLVYVGLRNARTGRHRLLILEATETHGASRIEATVSSGRDFVVVNGTVYTSGKDVKLRAYRPVAQP